MTRRAYLALAILFPIIVIVSYSIQNQYRYNDREEFILPISWKIDNDNRIFGYQLEFGFNPCVNSNSSIVVCLKPIKKAYDQLPANCSLFIKGFCAQNYFFPNYEQAPGVYFNPEQINRSSNAEVLVKISKAGFAEVVQLRPQTTKK